MPTKHHLGGRLGRQPEYDECEEWQENAGQDEDVVVERGDATQWYGKRQVRIGRVAARVVFDILLCRVTQNLPLVTCRVVTDINLRRHTHASPTCSSKCNIILLHVVHWRPRWQHWCCRASRDHCSIYLFYLLIFCLFNTQNNKRRLVSASFILQLLQYGCPVPTYFAAVRLYRNQNLGLWHFELKIGTLVTPALVRLCRETFAPVYVFCTLFCCWVKSQYKTNRQTKNQMAAW